MVSLQCIIIHEFYLTDFFNAFLEIKFFLQIEKLIILKRMIGRKIDINNAKKREDKRVIEFFGGGFSMSFYTNLRLKWWI